MNLGQAVKKIRQQEGLAQGAFAMRLGITQPYLSQVERNKRKPSLPFLEKLAEVSGRPIPVLFWYSLTIQDISEDKLEVYKALKPSIDNFVDDIFKK